MKPQPIVLPSHPAAKRAIVAASRKRGETLVEFCLRAIVERIITTKEKSCKP